jgi:uncharacterized lipoprotein YmbA
MKVASRWPLLLVLAFSACASANPSLYAIKPVPGTVAQAGPRTVVLQEVVLARYLDRLQIVRNADDYKLTVSSEDWWVEPLGSMLTRVLVQELSERLPGAIVVSDTNVIGAAPDATVGVSIQRLDGTSANEVVVVVQLAARFPKGAPRFKAVSFTVAQTSSDTRGFAAAASVAVGQVADAIAGMLLR